MKKILLRLFGIFIIIVIGLIVFFTQHFYPNTTLSCDGLTVEVGLESYDSAAQEVKSKLLEHTYTIVDSGGKTHLLKVSEVVEDIDITTILHKLKEVPKKINIHSYNLDLQDILKIDNKKVTDFFMSLSQEERVSEDAYISFNTELKEYTIIPEKLGTVLHEDSKNKFIAELKSLPNSIDLVEIGAYVLPAIVSTNSDLLVDLANLNSFKDVSLEYSFGNTLEVIDISVFNDWLFIEDSEVCVSEKKVKEFVKKLNSKYTTMGNTREFKNSYDTVITLTKGDYGWWLDSSKMEKNIVEHLSNKESVKEKGIYKQKAECYSSLDFTDSYVEISIENQHLWMYVKGELVIDCPVVTGCVNKGRSTPKGIYSLTYKTCKATLRGPGYACPVSYWMPFNGGIGLHDASWRGSFGNTIYINNGSHGCVNMPLNSAKIVYENLSSTMPIIVW